MKLILTRSISVTAFASRSLRVIATVAILCAIPAATNAAPSLAQELDTTTARPAQSNHEFYTTSAVPGSPQGPEVFAIDVSGSKITTRDVGTIHAGDCAALALSPAGTLYSMCGPLFGAQQLTTIDKSTGRGNLFGVATTGLSVMAMTFSPDGILYAVGDCNFDPTLGCTPGTDPNYNSLYTVNVQTGAFTRVGSTGAPEFFMDLAFDRSGNMIGVTTTLFPSLVPAILYRIDLATGKATKIVNLVGSNSVMGLAFDRGSKLYATDYRNNSGLYLIDMRTGFETAIAALPFGFSSGLELMNSDEGDRAGAMGPSAQSGLVSSGP
jgi:hypothetical protein